MHVENPRIWNILESSLVAVILTRTCVTINNIKKIR